MARPLRIEYPGAIHHVLSRGDRREAIVRDDADTGDDETIQAWDTLKPITDSNIAWIDAHTSEQNPPSENAAA